MNRRTWVRIALGAGVAVVGGAVGGAWIGTAQARPIARMTVYKTPTCGCCGLWVDHVVEHGFEAEVHDLPDLSQLKAQHGVPRELSSCHTAVVEGYVVEGHVPADVIQKLLEEKPSAVGIAVPGMPMGSPGMEGPFTQPYNVLLFDREGRTSVFASR